jgi:A118 family predicted phage portal protein
MFKRFFDFVKDWLKKMFDKNTVEKAVGVEIAVSDDMQDAIELWGKLYENEADWLSSTVKSLNLPSAIASEITRMVMLELRIEVSGSSRAEFLGEQMQNVFDKLVMELEYGCAKGGMVFKPYTYNGKILIDFVQADQFFPTKFDASGDLIGCIFVDQREINDTYYTRLEYHEMTTEDGYIVRNEAYRSKSESNLGNRVALSILPEWAELEEEVTVNDLDHPLFAYFKYPLANTVDPTSNVGVSCYSRAVDLIQNADEQWSKLLWEFESGERALYVDLLAFGQDADGNPTLPNKRLYKTLETGSEEGDLFNEWSPAFREQELLNGLNAILKKIEFQCGLAYGTLSDPNVEARTATEITTMKHRTFATVTNMQKAVEDALKQLFYAMNAWIELGGIDESGSGEYDVVFDFDDSVLNDTTQARAQDLPLVSQGIMSKLEYRMKHFREPEEVAKEKLALVAEQQKAEQPEPMFPDGE